MYDKEELAKWFNSNLTRGELWTKGDTYLGIRPLRNQLPTKTTDGYRATICCGAGCKIKIPFVFNDQHLHVINRFFSDVADAESERKALAKAVAEMELIVYREKLKNISRAELFAYSVPDFNDYSARLTQDCVDQASNGTSYLVILCDAGLLMRHQIIHPGRVNILLFQPHFFTRIRELASGHIYRFDLYHRGRFGIPPYVARIS